MTKILDAGAVRALGLLFAILSASPAAAWPSKTFGDWSVTCSDGLTCSATVFRAGDGIISSLGIRRSVDPGIPPVVLIGFSREEKPAGDIRFTIDEGEPIVVPATRFRDETVGFGIGLGDIEGGDRLRAAMRNGRTIQVALKTAAGEATATFSLKGLAASLRYLDEAQRRDGTRAAFVANGDKPAPDAAKLPKDIAKRSELPASVAKLWQDQGCGDVDEGDIGTLGFSTPLGEGRLYGLICGSPGAYNINYALFAEAGDIASVVPFPGVSAKGPSAAMTAMNIDWDDRTRLLTSFGKGRGLGDCGIWQSWTVADDASLTLVGAREKDDCDGKDEDIDQWPKLWPLTK